MNISSSASKIVLIIFAMTVCTGYLLNRMTAETFVTIAMLPIAAYFSDKTRKDPPSKDNTSLSTELAG